MTLLGQNVNSYGVEFGDRLRLRQAAARLRATIEGLERVRFTSPHPKDFTDDVIAAMAETPNVCHSLHMPLQSGSDAVLRAMRRSYRAERYLGIIDKVRAAMPDAAITTDIIVGFPGETEADFERTLDVVREARFAAAFTFQYSKRPGTPAADDGRPGAQGRWCRSVTSGWSPPSRRSPGRRTSKLVGSTGRGAGRGRRGPQGRAHRPDVRAGPGRPAGPLRRRARRPGRSGPGDIVHTTVTYAAPHHLNADGEPLAHRRTRAGDAYAAGQTPRSAGLCPSDCPPSGCHPRRPPRAAACDR